MAMSHVIRKTSSTVVPLALRAITSSRGAVLTNQDHFHSHQYHTTSAVDEKLVKVLKSEIKSMESRMPVIQPVGFPFIIEGANSSIKLKREVHGEKIEVFVRNLRVPEKEDDTKNLNFDECGDSSSTDDVSESDTDDSSGSSDEENDDAKNPPLISVPLQVNITKSDGTVMKIEVLGRADHITVENIEIYSRKTHSAYSTPFINDLGTEVHNCIREYIAIRGINNTNVEYLLKYIVRKPDESNVDHVLYERQLRFLENFKKFVAQS